MRDTATPVVVDPVRGHITVGDMTFSDLGRTLSVWAYSGCTLDPERAQLLGQALVAWATRKGWTWVQPAPPVSGNNAP